MLDRAFHWLICTQVPVERAQDIAAVGAGKLAKAAATADGGAVHVHGSGTAFVKQVKPGDQLLISAGACKGALAKVADVVSDELLVCAAPAFRGSDANPDATAADVKDAAFKVMPKVDHRAGKESEIPNFKGSSLGRFPLVSADFWTSDHL